MQDSIKSSKFQSKVNFMKSKFTCTYFFQSRNSTQQLQVWQHYVTVVLTKVCRLHPGVVFIPGNAILQFVLHNFLKKNIHSFARILKESVLNLAKNMLIPMHGLVCILKEVKCKMPFPGILHYFF